MANLPWLEEVRKRLVRHGLPPSYVQRFVAELTDHFHDLKEETMNTEADVCSRLGGPEQVANAAVVAYRRGSFLGRHPVAAFLVFGISPLASFILLAIVALLVLPSSFQQNDSLMIALCSTVASILYGEYATWLGIGKKWILVSCAVLATIAALCQLGIGVSAMLLVQSATPLVVGWWLTKRKCDHRRAAAILVIFVMSPVALYTVLSFTATITNATAYRFAQEHCGPVARDCWLFLFMAVVPMAVAGFLCYNVVRGFRSGRKWMWVAFVVLVTFPATLLSSDLPLPIVPMVVASLICCTFGRHFGLDRKWILMACIMLALYAGMQSFAEIHGSGAHDSVVQSTCRTLEKVLVPLAIGWWFIRQKRDEGQVQLAT